MFLWVSRVGKQASVRESYFLREGRPRVSRLLATVRASRELHHPILLRWLVTVPSTFKLLYFDGSILPQ